MMEVASPIILSWGRIGTREVKGDSMREFAQALGRDQTSVPYSSVLLFPAEQLGMVAVHSRS